MDSKAVRRGALTLLVGLALAAGVGHAGGASDTTFLSAEQLGEQLLGNVVKIRAIDRKEHGFGLVVGASARHVYIATARHVIGDARSERIEIAFCAGDDGSAGPRSAERVDEFAADEHDVALLRALRPPGYAPRLRALAEEASNEKGQETWLLGQAQQCGVAPRSGAIGALRDARENLRIDFPGALGGSSGGPVISGYGVLGLVTDAGDLTFTAFSTAALAAEVTAQMPGTWQLQAARNIPPTDPRAAQIDLAETLNLYLFSVRNLQGLLLQSAVPQKLFFDFSRDYNTAINRFRDARDRYDGTLQRDWPADVLPKWAALRDQLWQVHQVFWQLNEGDSKVIFEQRRSPPEVQARMMALEPQLKALQSGIESFLKVMSQRSPS